MNHTLRRTRKPFAAKRPFQHRRRFLLVVGALYLLFPVERTTSQSLRLDFAGAGGGYYPNGTAFSVADIVSEQVLNRVYAQNRLSDFVSFEEFSRSVWLLQANRPYEELAAEYQERLADPKL